MARTSFEGEAVEALLAALPPRHGWDIHRGLAADNRVQPTGWGLSVGQSLQFGDLRLEAPTVRVVVEVESAGGVGNLVKYWPLLATSLREKRFVLLHLFRLTSSGDYIAHQRLWEFTRDRMREDLEHRGLVYGRDWSADLLPYGPAADVHALAKAAERIVVALSAVGLDGAENAGG